MACVVSPVDQVLPVAEEDVSVRDCPWQMVVEPPAVIVGVAGAPGSSRVAETVLEVQAFVSVKLYVPAPKPEPLAGKVT